MSFKLQFIPNNQNFSMGGWGIYDSASLLVFVVVSCPQKKTVNAVICSYIDNQQIISLSHWILNITMWSINPTNPSTTTSSSQGPTKSGSLNQDSSHSLSRLEMLPSELVSQFVRILDHGK